MLTGVFKDRSAQVRRERLASEEQALAELLSARELRGFALVRRCEIGPFVVDHLFPEQSLVVELAAESPLAPLQTQRAKFLNDMGYTVLTLDPKEVTRHPRRALARLQAALEN